MVVAAERVAQVDDERLGETRCRGGEAPRSSSPTSAPIRRRPPAASVTSSSARQQASRTRSRSPFGSLASRSRSRWTVQRWRSAVGQSCSTALVSLGAAAVDASYAAYDEHPLEEPDEWGDLASFRRAAAASSARSRPAGRCSRASSPRSNVARLLPSPATPRFRGCGGRWSRPARRRSADSPARWSSSPAPTRSRSARRQPRLARERVCRRPARTTRASRRRPNARGLRRPSGRARLRRLRRSREVDIHQPLVDFRRPGTVGVAAHP